jgi:hypothetical protein
MRMLGLAAAFLFLISAKEQGPPRIAIILPTNSSSVSERPIVEGTVSSSKAIVWVIVHPLEVSDYWVQPLASVQGKDSWRTQIHVGRPGDADVGKLFEIRAVANPKAVLREGLVLNQWPEAVAVSNAVTVTRK